MTATTIKQVSDVSPRERWEMEINAARQELEQFYKRGNFAAKKFVDEREAMNQDARWFNIFYANTNIMESALYAQLPKPKVTRKYKDYMDQTARVAALILERTLCQDFNDPSDTFDSTMRQCVQDRLVPGLGTAWLRLETDTEDIPESEGGSITNDTFSNAPGPEGAHDGFPTPAAEESPSPSDGEPPGEAVPLKRILEQRVAVDYVHWQDFLWSPCRVWTERRWVARRVYMDYDSLVRRFGEAKAKLTSLDYCVMPNAQDDSGKPLVPQREVMQKAIVYEIWDRISRKVYWYAPGYPKELLDEKDDFLLLQDFDPCPKPMFANVGTSNLTPRPDYYMIQDQYQELDLVNARIAKLVEACKVVGLYPQNSKAVADMLKGNENTMIPVENWSQFAEKGGADGQLAWLPLEAIVAALQQLYASRDMIKGQIYELTGIADIVRGASKASETLGAQQIKAQFASVRIKKLQDEVARFASDILRIKAEIMVKHFDVDILIRKSGIIYTPNHEYIPAAISLLQSEEGFKWRVTVQSDSMAQADYAMEKQDRIEFMSAVSSFMGQALPMTIQVPETKPIIVGLLQWGISGFKQADEIEGMLDRQLEQIQAKPPAPPPPDPKVQAAQLKAQTDEKKAQMDAQAKQQDMEMKREEHQMEMVKMDRELQMQQQMNEMEMQLKRFELMFKQFELQLKAQGEKQKMELDAQKGQMDLEQSAIESQQNIEFSRQEHAQNMELSREQGKQQLEQSDAAHKQTLKQSAEAAKAKNKESKNDKT